MTNFRDCRSICFEAATVFDFQDGSWRLLPSWIYAFGASGLSFAYRLLMALLTKSREDVSFSFEVIEDFRFSRWRLLPSWIS
jgi:hypothetical protein